MLLAGLVSAGYVARCGCWFGFARLGILLARCGCWFSFCWFWVQVFLAKFIFGFMLTVE